MGKTKKQQRRQQRLESGPMPESSPGPPSPRLILDRPVLHLLLIALLGVLCYANTLEAPFVFDDRNSIVENPVIKNLAEFLSGEGYRFNPRRFIGYLSFALNYHFGGLDVTGYHLANLVIHICCAWLLYALLRLTFRTPLLQGSFLDAGNRRSERADLIALGAALLFVAHPVQTQAVTYIVQRFASLATLFYLLAVVGYVRARVGKAGVRSEERGTGDEGRENPGRGTRDAGPGRAKIILNFGSFPWYLLALVAAVLAMKTKEIAFTLPFAIVLYEFSFFGSTLRKKLLFLAPVLLTALILPIGLVGAGRPIGELISDVSAMTRETDLISRSDYLLTQFSVIVTYLRLLILPINQNLDYDYPIYHSLFEPRVFLSALLLAGLLAVAIYLFWTSGKRFRDRGSRIEDRGQRTKDNGQPVTCPQSPITRHASRFTLHASRLISFGILWFFLTLSVESSIIPIRDVIFEHRLYLPSVGMFMALVGLMSALAEKVTSRLAFTISLAGVIALGATTVARNAVWGSALILWQDVALKSPDKPRALTNLGFAYRMVGNVDTAIEMYGKSLKIMPDSAVTHTNLGYAYGLTGNFEKELAHYRLAIEIDPRYAEAWADLGAALAQSGRLEEGINALQQSLSLERDNAEAHFNLGLAYRKFGLAEQAEHHYLAALKLDPAHSEAFNNLGILYLTGNQKEEAIACFRSALSLCPDDPGYRRNLEIAQRSSSSEPF